MCVLVWVSLSGLVACHRAPALHVYARTGSKYHVLSILNQGEDINRKDDQGRTALFYAAWGGENDMVKLLISKGAQVNAQGTDGETALITASDRCHPSTVKILLEAGADLTRHVQSHSTAWTGLMIAATKGCEAVIETLLAAGADTEETFGDNSLTPLWAASANGHASSVMALLAGGANVNHRSKGGITPLLVAAQRGHRDVVKVLLDAGADVRARVTARDNSLFDEGDTALRVANRKGHSEIARLLQAAGAKE